MCFSFESKSISNQLLLYFFTQLGISKMIFGVLQYERHAIFIGIIQWLFGDFKKSTVWVNHLILLASIKALRLPPVYSLLNVCPLIMCSLA